MAMGSFLCRCWVNANTTYSYRNLEKDSFCKMIYEIASNISDDISYILQNEWN